MIETSIGLPNSCSVCGLPITEKTWWAADLDAARNGGGMHAGCLSNGGAVVSETPNPLEFVAPLNVPDTPIKHTAKATRKPKATSKKKGTK